MPETRHREIFSSWFNLNNQDEMLELIDIIKEIPKFQGRGFRTLFERH
jgi:hypothetical protein